MRLKAEDLFRAYPDNPGIQAGHLANAQVLAQRVNAVLEAFEADGNAPLNVSPVTGTLISVRNGGWRPPTMPGGSAHKFGGAVDLHDPDARLDKWLLGHQELLEELDLYMEDPSATAGQVTKGGWCHLAIFKGNMRTGGNRVFIP